MQVKFGALHEQYKCLCMFTSIRDVFPTSTLQHVHKRAGLYNSGAPPGVGQFHLSDRLCAMDLCGHDMLSVMSWGRGGQNPPSPPTTMVTTGSWG
jgi:hypothetical protein